MIAIEDHLNLFLNELEITNLKVQNSEIVNGIERFLQSFYTSMDSIDCANSSSYLIIKKNKGKIFVFQIPPEDLFSQNEYSMFDLSQLEGVKVDQKINLDLANQNLQFKVLNIFKGKHLIEKKEIILKRLGTTDLMNISTLILQQIVKEKKIDVGKKLFHDFVNHLDSKNALNYTDQELEEKITENIRFSNFRIPESKEHHQIIAQKNTTEIHNKTIRKKHKHEAQQKLKRDIVGQALVDLMKIKNIHSPSHEGELFFSNIDSAFSLDLPW